MRFSLGCLNKLAEIVQYSAVPLNAAVFSKILTIDTPWLARVFCIFVFYCAVLKWHSTVYAIPYAFYYIILCFAVVVWTVSYEQSLLYIINVLPVFFRNALLTLVLERDNHMVTYIWVNIWRHQNITWISAEYHEWENYSFRLVATSPRGYWLVGHW